MPNLRKYPRGRPQILQRLWRRVEKTFFFRASSADFVRGFAFSLASFTRFAVVAKNQLLASGCQLSAFSFPFLPLKL